MWLLRNKVTKSRGGSGDHPTPPLTRRLDTRPETASFPRAGTMWPSAVLSPQCMLTVLFNVGDKRGWKFNRALIPQGQLGPGHTREQEGPPPSRPVPQTLPRPRGVGATPGRRASTGFIPGEPQREGQQPHPRRPRGCVRGEGTRSRQTRRQAVGVSLLEVRKTGTQSPTQISREKQNCPISTQTTQRCYWSGSQGAGPGEGRPRRTWEHMPYSQPSESAAAATVAPRQ